MSTTATTTIQPYIFFGGRCDEALAFYKTALGAKVDFLMRYKESPNPAPPGMLAPGWEEKVMHTTFRIGDAIVMASDGCSPEDGKSSGFKLALNVPTEAEAVHAFAGLSDGGTVALTSESDLYTTTKWADLDFQENEFYDTPGATDPAITDFVVLDTGARIAETWNCVPNNLAPPVFANGVESGNTSGWSQAVP